MVTTISVSAQQCKWHHRVVHLTAAVLLRFGHEMYVSKYPSSPRLLGVADAVKRHFYWSVFFAFDVPRGLN